MMDGPGDIGGASGVETIVEDEGWNAALDNPARLAAACYDAAARLEPSLTGAAAALFMTDDETVRELNARFRGKDAPTNVLAFPAEGAGRETHGGGPAVRFLGDIALARQTCLREADEKGVGAADHAAHLIVHGVLHLIGYDHQHEKDAVDMERRERAILELLGVADPYADESFRDKIGTL